MRKALEVLNQLERDGVIGRYAIGGAVGAIFYMEPVATEDLDVFVLIPGIEKSLTPLSSLYQCLRDKGYREGRECVKIEGVAVQFLPAFNPLILEALDAASQVDYEGVSARVMRPEHLAAIMLQTGRPKDRERFAAFFRQAPLDKSLLDAVLLRHQLRERFESWTK